MTDRVNSLQVALEKDVRDDDVQSLISAIMHMRGVLTVAPNITDPSDWTSGQRVKASIREKLIQIIKDDL